MRLLLDMNVPPFWVELLARRGWAVRHWSTVGDLRATDEQIMAAARQTGDVVVTLDLDFSRILAISRAAGPSVVLIRAMDVLAGETVDQVASGIQQLAGELEAGALVVVEPQRRRVRSLPIARP